MTSPTRFAPIAILLLVSTTVFAQKLTPRHISLANGKSFDLNLPEGYEINIAAQGLKRVRFMAMSPDNRLFVTDMFDLSDNRRGVVYILDQFDSKTRQFKKITKYMTGLHNPNSITFYKDSDGVDWFYLGLTDRLVRYRYEAGKDAPSGEPQVLATFPAYGLSYKYGGWHLTRTVVVGGDKLYVAVGSSCNACEEKEEVRASILQMNPDGTNKKYLARGLRNAVGLRWVRGKLYATNMGSDHLGYDRPADTFYALENSETHYGWPYCFQAGTRVYPDPKFNPTGTAFDCRKVPAALTPFPAHSSPLGLEYFDADNSSDLNGSFLVALHGSTKKSLRRGYRVVKVRASNGSMTDFLTGFFDGVVIYGRPADVFSFGKDAFLLTDDYSGVVYYVSLHR
jgi:glucose/arabinose dehydrogenase